MTECHSFMWLGIHHRICMMGRQPLTPIQGGWYGGYSRRINI